VQELGVLGSLLMELRGLGVGLGQTWIRAGKKDVMVVSLKGRRP